jgi:hypothetical protein
MSDSTTMYAFLITYKIMILLSGVAFAYMGFRLFLADKLASAGDFSASAGSYTASLKGGAPGVFFSMFGAALIIFSIVKGVRYDSFVATQEAAPIVIPSRPPE